MEDDLVLPACQMAQVEVLPSTMEEEGGDEGPAGPPVGLVVQD